MTRRGKGRTCSTEKLREELFSLLKELRDSQVIVEGIRDKRALKMFKFSNVHTINKSLYETATKFTGAVLVFTDFDPEGERIAKKLTELLVKVGCRVDVISRKRARRLFIKNKMNTIEGLRKLIR